MFVIFFIIISIFIFIFGNILIYKSIVNKALVLYLNPYFENKKSSVFKTKFVGFLSSGDFKNTLFQIRPVSKAGKIFNNTYVYIYIQDHLGNKHRYTVNIKTFFLKIKKVILKSEEKNVEIELL